MCCEDEVADFPAVVAQMVAAARLRLLSPESWGADAWTIPARTIACDCG